MAFDHFDFSKALKISLANYLENEFTDDNKVGWYLDELGQFNLHSLSEVTRTMSFWINVYNGFTNYQIISNQLKNSVWEMPDFFSNRGLQIEDLFFSLDDIEHGILRRNGKRRNGKPLQFKTDDPKMKLMVDNFDERIHFALNCGSISCPPLAFYSEGNLLKELEMAEEVFTSQEFLVNHERKTITCSQIFVWYRDDFKDRFLNDPQLSQYHVIERPYEWKIK